ncbi:MAG: hypothetical protein LBU51_01700 [Bacteroidales bacterium]|jgi:hypothetical protein|nr:hypothetical protein [Bacteroidales bacterium]
MIQKLIEKYYSGETTSSEETLLRNYFLQEEIPEPLKSYQPLFIALSDLHDHKELFSIPNHFNTLHHRKNNVWKIAAAITGIAASLLLLFLLHQNLQPESWVMIEGHKMTTKTEIEQAIQQSFENVKINEDDFFFYTK